MSPFPRCSTCGKRVEHCECPDADEDDGDYVEPYIEEATEG
jgi:hypothetical protein